MAAPTQGVALALTTGFCWALAPLCWSLPTRRIGSLNVNLLRMLMAVVVLGAILLPYQRLAGASFALSPAALMWLAISGIIHMALGGAFYYESIRRLGPRRAVQFLTLFPIWAVLIAWLWLGEKIPPAALCGIAMVIGSISYLAYAEGNVQQAETREPGKWGVGGLACGVLASIGIGAGAVLSRRAFRIQPSADPILATTVRMAAACAALWLWPIFRGSVARSLASLADRPVLWRMIGGTIVGPLVGMATYVAAVKSAEAGLVSTLAATSPLFILPLVALRYRVRIGPAVLLAIAGGVAGVALIYFNG